MMYSRFQLSIFPLVLVAFFLGKSATGDKDLKDHFSKMIYIEGGEFTMNLASRFIPTSSDSTLFSQCIPRRASVGPYFLSATEITNSEWKDFYEDKVLELGKIKAKERFYPDTSLWLKEFKYTYNLPHARNYFSHPKFRDFPVVGISWVQANSYCQWKTEKVNKLLKTKEKRDSITFRLPTEIEWEFAAIRKRNENKIENLGNYSWPEEKMLSQILDLTNLGEVYDKNGILLKTYADDGCIYPCEVASYPPNDHGLYDMSGNVSEWTADAGSIRTTFFDNYDSKTLSTSIEIENEIVYIKNNLNIKEFEVASLLQKLDHDQIVFAKENIKICKGGSWARGLIYAQPGSRQGLNKDRASVKTGFRIVTSFTGEEIQKYFPKKNWKPR